MQNSSRSRWRVGTLVLVQVLAGFGLEACDVAEQPRTETETPAAKRQAAPEIALNSVDVLKVRLRKELIRPDASGLERAWSEAFMVRLGLTLPEAKGPALEIYLDGDRVPEYGGWENGIYFWVYDPEELAALDGSRVSYRFGRSDRREIGRLTLGDRDKYRETTEAEVFHGQ